MATMTLDNHIVVTDELNIKYNDLLDVLGIEPVGGMVFHIDHTGREVVCIKGSALDIKMAVTDLNTTLKKLNRIKLHDNPPNEVPEAP